MIASQLSTPCQEFEESGLKNAQLARHQATLVAGAWEDQMARHRANSLALTERAMASQKGVARAASRRASSGPNCTDGRVNGNPDVNMRIHRQIATCSVD